MSASAILPPSARTVRFAPLPDPRRPLSPLSAHSDVSSSSQPRRSNYPLENYPNSPASELPPSTPAPTLPAPSCSSKASSHNRMSSLLRPFFRKSTASDTSSPPSDISLTPTPSIDSSNPKQNPRRSSISADITISTRNLFRTASRSSRSIASDSAASCDLNRWPSAPAAVKDPLAIDTRSQSFISAGDNNRGSKRHFFGKPTAARTSAGTAGTASTASTSVPRQGHSRKGIRMLNGRVYGRSQNHFANIKDTEPEFVEWGYGGMGSVRGRHAAGMGGTRWDRLHTADDPSLDDGSGMGWVKKRREAREREQKAKEQEMAENDTPADSETTTTTASPPSPLPNPTRPGSRDSSTTPRSNYVISSGGEHLLHAITIPADFQRHHHHHHHRSMSKTGPIISIGSDDADADLAHHHAAENQPRESVETESDDSAELRDDEDDEDSDGEEPERRTAIGAGVEKFTRHKDVEHDLASPTLPVTE